jgi:amino acid transporter
MTAPTGLAKKSVGASSLFWFCVGASAPMTVIGGALIATYAITGVVGVPLSFLVLALALAFFTVGYVAMSRHVPHAATFYAYLARGLGKVWGVSGAAVALLAYNSLQIGLYGLLSALLADLIGGEWWVWALLACALVALLGVLHVRVNAVVLATVLACEIAVIGLFDLAAFTHPAGGSISWEPLLPSSLIVDGVGGVLALAIAAFVGFETAPVYGEEARSHRAVSRASFWSLGFCGLLYTVSAWALAVTVGPTAVIEAARDPDSGMPFAIVEQYYGKGVFLLSLLLLMTSIFAAMLSFHNTIGRYVFGLSREGVLPRWFSRVGSSGSTRAGAPVGGSLLQSGVAAVVILAFAMAGADPLAMLFTWLTTIAAVGVMVLMLASNLAVINFFRRGGGAQETAWQRIIAPAIGTVVLFVILAVTVSNLSSLMGAEPGSVLTWLPPILIASAAVAGLIWGITLRARPAVYQRIGVGEPETLAVLETDLSDLRV